MAGPNQKPIFVQTPTIDMVIASSANTNRDGTGTLATLATGTTYGKRIGRIVFVATGATTAGQIRIFVDDGGGNIRLQKEIAVTAATPSATVQAFTAEWVRTDGDAVLILPSGYICKIGVHNAEAIACSAHSGLY